MATGGTATDWIVSADDEIAGAAASWVTVGAVVAQPERKNTTLEAIRRAQESGDVEKFELAAKGFRMHEVIDKVGRRDRQRGHVPDTSS